MPVLGGYLDRFKPGHQLIFDLVLNGPAGALPPPPRQLWLPDAGWPWLLPIGGHGQAVAITRRRLISDRRLPYQDAVGRLTGLARASAALWRGTGLTHWDRWIDH